MKYTAQSLADIADHFDKLGKNLGDQLRRLREKRLKPTKEMVQLEAAMHAYYNCRDIIKQTEIQSP